MLNGVTAAARAAPAPTPKARRVIGFESKRSPRVDMVPRIIVQVVETRCAVCCAAAPKADGTADGESPGKMCPDYCRRPCALSIDCGRAFGATRCINSWRRVMPGAMRRIVHYSANLQIQQRA